MRRLFCESLNPGRIVLGESQSHHARSVLRLVIGDEVELFDPSGRTARAVIDQLEPAVALRVEFVADAPAVPDICIASAVPKGDRADWLVEKLGEIGIARWVPLKTARSVVHPQGESKFDRWHRIATEAARQSRRVGVMEIAPLTDLSVFLTTVDPTQASVLSTNPRSIPFTQFLNTKHQTPNTLLIGPEGGWSDNEVSTMHARGLTGVSLGRTILRVETAAVVAAGIVSVVASTMLLPPDRP
ncbi:MAG: 16S rRNA (uracil(1498)-N(3))-methyltransferase [Burkholderiales bacterium]|nr:16S rRNA (uracil(1498)-N(3))-methyltransferase [Phycisphaerae bacterium]